jgi:hypothetical protein
LIKEGVKMKEKMSSFVKITSMAVTLSIVLLLITYALRPIPKAKPFPDLKQMISGIETSAQNLSNYQKDKIYEGIPSETLKNKFETISVELAGYSKIYCSQTGGPNISALAKLKETATKLVGIYDEIGLESPDDKDRLNIIKGCQQKLSGLITSIDELKKRSTSPG